MLRFKVEGDPASLSFSFINDLYEKGVGDRNLVLKSFAINGQSVAEDRFSSDHESRKFNMASATTITLRRPDSGWSLIQTTSKEPGAAEVTAPSEVSPTAIGQAASSTESAPSDTASTCSAVEFVVPFARSSLAVSEEDFVPVLAAAKAAGCRIRVIGYADRSGPTQLNKSISEARGKAVVDLLIRGGIDEDSITVNGRGETQEFGTAAANRRVAISVEP